MRNAFKPFISRILIVLCSLVVSLVVIEIVLRLFAPPEQFVVYTEPHDVLGFWFKPGAYYDYQAPERCEGWGSSGYINSLGLRDQEHSYDKPPDVFRILALGDSMTAGFHFALEQTWTKLLETRLNGLDGDLRYEVINAGRPGLGTGDEYLYYVSEGYKYHPDLVMMLFTPNDINENSRDISANDDDPLFLDKPYFSFEGNTLLIDNSFHESQGYAVRKQINWLRTNFYIVTLVRDGYNAVRNARNADVKKDSLSQSSLPSEPSTVEYAALDTTQKLFTVLNDAVLGNDAQFVLIHGSDSSQVNCNLPPRSHLESGPAFLNTNELIGEFAQQAGIAFLDLVPPFCTFSKENNTIIHGCTENGGFGHWNTQGHLLAADMILTYLVEQQLIPG